MDLYNLFWSTSIWVPPGYTWDDLRPTKDRHYPDSDDLWTYPFIFAGLFLAFNYLILSPFVFDPLAKYYKVRSKPYKQPPSNSKLETIHKKYKAKPPHELVEKLASEIGWTERQVQRWLRQKTVSQQVTVLEKFRDCAWQLTYYVCYCILGIVVLHDKPWLYDLSKCWHRYPHLDMTNDIWWYYMVALGYYWGQTLTHFLQPQRKDSLRMLCHHLVTILLMSLSFTINMVRMGSLILLVHECADIPLLLAKLCGYCGRPFLMDGLFVVFVLLWIITRLGIFPFKIIKSTLLEAHVQQNTMYPIYYMFNGLLLAIFVMHLLWTYNIIQVIAHKFSSNHIADVRSSEGELSDDGEEIYPVRDSQTKKKKIT